MVKVHVSDHILGLGITSFSRLEKPFERLPVILLDAQSL